MSDFDDLEALTFEQILIAVDVLPLDRVTRLPVPDFVTTAPRLFTEAGDTPPSRGYKSVVATGWKTTRRLTQPGKFLAPSTFNVASLLLSNRPPAAGLPGPLDDWLSQDWNDRPIIVRAGGRVTAAGLPYPFSSYETIWTGVTDDLIPRADGSLELRLVGRARELSKPVADELYRGFGGAAQVSAPELLETKSLATWDLTEGAIDFFGIVPSFGSGHRLIAKESGDYGVILNSAGLVGYRWDGANVFSTFAATAGKPLYAGLSFDKDALLTLHAGRDGRDVSTVLTAQESPVAQTTSRLFVGQSFGSGVVEVWDARIWSQPRDLDTSLGVVDTPLTDPLGQAAENGLVAYWKLGEGTGEIARDEVDNANGELAHSGSGLVWVSSLEGDDPVQFGGSSLGQAKPRVLGPANNVLLASVDSQRRDYQWSLRASNDLTRVKTMGGPLFPDETITTAGVGELAWDDVAKTLTIVSGGHTFRRYVPGQVDPAVNGQRVDITIDATYAGVYRVAEQVIQAGTFISGISDDGLVMSLLDDATGLPPSLPTGDLATGAVLRPPESARHFTFDLLTSTVRTIDHHGDLTADVAGELSGASGSKLSELFEILAGEAADTSALTFDPPLGIAFAKGSRVTRKAALDQIAFSGVASWVEDRAGGYRLATFTVPAGVPVATIAGSRLSDLGDEFSAPIIGRIKDIRPVRTKIPAWRLTTGYARTWHVQDADSLIGAITAAERALLSEPYRWAVRTLSSVRTTYPTSDPLAPFQTLLLTLKDAETHLSLAKPLYAVKPRWYSCQVQGLALFALEPGDLIWLQWPDRTFGIVTPVRARILALTEDTSSDTVTLEAFTSE